MYKCSEKFWKYNYSFVLFNFNSVGGIAANRDPLPYYHSLKNSAHIKTAVALSPAYGGNTCNAEFEFLTNMAMLFLPKNSTPYMTAIQKPISTWPTHLKNLGYETVAVHPMDETN